MVKAIIVVLACDREGYDKMIKSIRDTWGSDERVSVFYNYGYREGYDKPEEGRVICVSEKGNTKKDVIISGYEESYENIGWKTVSMFEYLLANYEFDFLFRCCAGSYIHIDNFLKYVETLKKDNHYSGRLGIHKNEFEGGEFSFRSGSGFFISRDLLEWVVSNKEHWDHRFMDDVALGKLLGDKKQIKGTDNPRYDMDNGILHQNLPLNHFHYHFRYVPWKFRGTLPDKVPPPHLLGNVLMRMLYIKLNTQEKEKQE